MCKLLIFLQFPSVGNLKKNLKNIFKNFFFFVIGLQDRYCHNNLKREEVIKRGKVMEEM